MKLALALLLTLVSAQAMAGTRWNKPMERGIKTIVNKNGDTILWDSSYVATVGAAGKAPTLLLRDRSQYLKKIDIPVFAQDTKLVSDNQLVFSADDQTAESLCQTYGGLTLVTYDSKKSNRGMLATLSEGDISMTRGDSYISRLVCRFYITVKPEGSLYRAPPLFNVHGN